MGLDETFAPRDTAHGSGYESFSTHRLRIANPAALAG
jgi:hypothetical protein